MMLLSDISYKLSILHLEADDKEFSMKNLTIIP